MIFDFLKIPAYDLSERETIAYKCCLCYLKYKIQFFPNSPKNSIPKGDPRKTELFRYCWKMLDEIEHEVQRSEIPLFVYAQLFILKSNENCHVYPNCLVGEKAKNRWLLYNKQYKKTKIIEKPKTALDIEKVKQELQNTFKFLNVKFKPLRKQDILDAYRNRLFHKWLALKQVSPYYLWLSPHIQLSLNGKELSEIFSTGLNLYKEVKDNQEIQQFFTQIFTYEYPV